VGGHGAGIFGKLGWRAGKVDAFDCSVDGSEFMSAEKLANRAAP